METEPMTEEGDATEITPEMVQGERLSHIGKEPSRRRSPKRAGNDG